MYGLSNKPIQDINYSLTLTQWTPQLWPIHSHCQSVLKEPRTNTQLDGSAGSWSINPSDPINSALGMQTAQTGRLAGSIFPATRQISIKNS